MEHYAYTRHLEATVIRENIDENCFKSTPGVLVPFLVLSQKHSTRLPHNFRSSSVLMFLLLGFKFEE